MASLEAAARDWLTDPAWNKLFKNIFDIAEDQICRGLVALAAISLAVRFLANLPSGDLLCIVIGFDTNGTFGSDVRDLAGPWHATLTAYAAQDPGCYEAVFVHNNHPIKMPGFIVYGPIMMMMQAVFLIALEKVWIIFPRLSRKMEIFYKCVVEETLLGKDPDVAEDFTGGALDKDKIVRQRQREEICGALRNSSLLLQMYILKNSLQLIFAILFIVFNYLWGLQSDDNVGECPIKARDNTVWMQCRQKRFGFYITMLWSFIVLLAFHIMTSIGSLIWSIEYFGLRKISSIVEELDQKEERQLRSVGSDFLFLFDLIAHSCGQPATLRVLSYTDEEFLNLCQPKLTQMKMTETSIKLVWSPSKLEEFHDSNSKIMITNYVVTILPNYNNKQVRAIKNENEVEFDGLEGGKKEYIFTVSAYISDDVRMKGLTQKTFLPPFPPRNLQCELQDEKDAERASIKIRWTKPKGEFDSYILGVKESASEEDNRTNSISADAYKLFRSFHKPIRDEIWLGGDQEEYKKTGLKPGVKYMLVLRSMTGNFSCLEPVKKQIITKPSKPDRKLFDIKTSTDKLMLFWGRPSEDGNTALTGYNVELFTFDGTMKVVYEKYQNKNQLCLSITRSILSGTQYTARLAAVCKEEAKDGVKEEIVHSDYIEKTVTTPPLPPTNLRLEKSGPTYLIIAWNPPSYIPSRGELTYSISIDPLNSNVNVRKEMKEKRTQEVEKPEYKFCNLPEIGSGGKYKITVKTILKMSEETVYSVPVSDVFTTNPFPPGNFVVEDEDLPDQPPIFAWEKSQSKTVEHYKLELKGIGIDFEKEYICLPNANDDIVRYEFEDLLETEVDYVLTIYSEVRSIFNGKHEWIKSKPLEVQLSTVTDSNDNKVKIHVVEVRGDESPVSPPMTPATHMSLRNSEKSRMSLHIRNPSVPMNFNNTQNELNRIQNVIFSRNEDPR